MKMANQQTVQISSSPALIAPNGQFIRAQNILQASNLVQNGGAIVTSGGQNVVRSNGVPQVVQFPIQQTIPVQIPIATSNGQTIIQTVHIPIQTLATAFPNNGNIIQGGQIQVLQPQLTQIPQQHQLAQVITPSGQIQLAQIQPAQNNNQGQSGTSSWTSNANGTITIQTTGNNDGGNSGGTQVSSTTQASSGGTGGTQTIVTAQSQPSQQLTIQSSNQQFTVIPTSSLGQTLGQQIPTLQNIPGLGNVQLIPAGTLTLAGQGQNVTLQQQGTGSTQQILQIGSSPIVTGLQNIGMGTQQLQQDPLDPTKWQVVNQAPLVVATSLSNSTMATIKTELDKPKTRLRRVACTCPNCTDIDARNNGEKKKQHLCHIPGCGKVYGKTSHLRAHLRWHAGERPFVCQWLFCGKRFTRSDELQRHRRTHTGEKRFQCSECMKKFMRSDHLSKHIKTHSKSRCDQNVNGVSPSKISTDGKLIKTEVQETDPLDPDNCDDDADGEDGSSRGDGCMEDNEGDLEETESERMMITISADGEHSELIIKDCNSDN